MDQSPAPARDVEADAGLPEVAILLGLCNGGRWLSDQLASIAGQEGARWRLVVSDDGSRDAGPELVEAFGRRHRAELVAGPRRGAAANFMHLIREAPDAAYTALCDQDDVWLPGKLARAVARLSEVPGETPALYCGRTVICDETLRRTGLSPLFARPPSFRNALTQSLAGGNTMVLNAAALAVARAAAAGTAAVVMHDWWLYQIVAGAGGQVIYDPEPMVLYRQHGGNQIGSNASLAAQMDRARHVARGRFRRWNDVNIAALRAAAHLLTDENRRLLEAFDEARHAPFARRIALLRGLGLYRQTARGNVSWWAAAAAGLI